MQDDDSIWGVAGAATNFCRLHYEKELQAYALDKSIEDKKCQKTSEQSIDEAQESVEHDAWGNDKVEGKVSSKAIDYQSPIGNAAEVC